MNDHVDIEIVRSIMPETGQPDRAAHDRARARFIASTEQLRTGEPRRFGWLRRRVGVGGISVPVVVLGVVATAAAATGSLIAVSATTLFEKNPQRQLMPSRPAGKTVPFKGHHGARARPNPETVIPASVREFASATVPDYGEVQFWGAPTKQQGFCFAIKLPNGAWGGYPLSRHPTGGWVGGSIPGCTNTQQHAVMTEPAVPAGQRWSAANGDLVGPTPVEQWNQVVRSRDGRLWNLVFGYVNVLGTAATVRDPANGVTARVSPDGYYLLVEPANSHGGGDLQVFDSDGHKLKPDYTFGGTISGHKPGPSQH